MKLSHLAASSLAPLLLSQSGTDQSNCALAANTPARAPNTESRDLRHDRPDFSGLDPKGRRVNFFGDFYETPDAPPGGAHLERILPGERIYLQFVADTGAEIPNERNRVLHSMRADNQKHRANARFLLGDLVYDDGVQGPNDPAIEKRVSVFAQPREHLEAFAVLGNHDLGKKNQPLPDAYAYLDQARSHHTTQKQAPTNTKGAGLSMIDRYYDVTFRTAEGNPLVQVILLDTNVLARDAEQQTWLEETLKNSTAKHVIIAGHHPLKSAGPEHLTPPPFADWLSKLAKQHGVSAMIFGHEHNLQARLSDKLPPQFIVGAGSKMEYPPGTHHGKKTGVKHSKTDTITAFGVPGFGTLKANNTHAEFSLLKAKKSHKTRTLLHENLRPITAKPYPLYGKPRATQVQEKQSKSAIPRWLMIGSTSAALFALMAAAAKWRHKLKQYLHPLVQGLQRRNHYGTDFSEKHITLLPLVKRPTDLNTYGSIEGITLTV